MKRSDFNTIIELPIEFDGRGSTKGFKFKQVYHNNGWYIYEVKGEYYEVFKEKIGLRCGSPWIAHQTC